MATTKKVISKEVEKVTGLSLMRKFALNKEAEEQGAWFDLEGGARIKVARFGNAMHGELDRKLREERRTVLEGKDSELADKANVEILIKVMSLAILKDWENILDENGKPLKFSQEVAEKYLDELDDFRAIVYEIAATSNNYRLYKEGEAVKNS